MFGTMAPGMPKIAKPKKPKKWRAPSMAYRGVTQQPVKDPYAAPEVAAVAGVQGSGSDDEAGVA